MYVVVRVRSPCSVGFVVLQTFESDRLFAVEAASSVRGDATLQTKDLPVSFVDMENDHPVEQSHIYEC